MKQIYIILITIFILLTGNEAFTYPCPGIVVDRQGNVYFLDTGSDLWNIDQNGKLTHLSRTAYHWLAIYH